MGKLSPCGKSACCAFLLILVFARSVLAQAGAVDPTFNPGSGANGNVNSVLAEPGGKILIGGAFDSFNGNASPRLVRLNPNGTVATAFSGDRPEVNSIALGANNQLLLATDGGPRRLNYDGSPDSSFTIPFSDPTYWIGPYTNSDIIVAGGFGGRIARLAEDGSPLPFDTGHQYPWDDEGIYSCIVRSNGNIIVGGQFRAIDDQPRGSLAELKSDGGLVPGEFVGTLYGNPGGFETVVTQPDGKVLAGGWYCCGYQGLVVRYTAEGQFDSTFSFARIDGLVLAVAVQSDGKILVGGERVEIGGSTGYLTRLLPDGSVDPTFNVGTGPNDIVTDIKIQTDGRILIGGRFSEVNGQPSKGIARLFADAPQLNLELLANKKIRLSWGAQFTGWVLQERNHMGNDLWKTVHRPPNTSNGVNYLNIPLRNDHRFYRLALIE